jgi:SAM-dependent methyltransferase
MVGFPSVQQSSMSCPICRNAARRRFQNHGYWILECLICHHRFAEIAISENQAKLIYDDQYFQGGRDGYPDYLSESGLLIAQGRRYGALLKRYMPPGKMLDVGSAAGLILKGFQESGWIGKGLEPNSRMADYARTHLGLEVENGTLEEYSDETRYDLVSMIQVVPHFFDLQKALRVAAGITKSGGFWLIETWNKDSMTAKVLGQHWHEYSTPSVLHWFSQAGLRRLVEQFGFKEVMRGRPVKYIYPVHARFLLRYRLNGSVFGKLACKILDLTPDRFPIPYLADDIFWAIYRKS